MDTGGAEGCPREGCPREGLRCREGEQESGIHRCPYPTVTSKCPPGIAKFMAPGHLVPLICRLLNQCIVSGAAVIPLKRALSGPSPHPPSEHRPSLAPRHTKEPLCPWPGEPGLSPESSTGSRPQWTCFLGTFCGPGFKQGWEREYGFLPLTLQWRGNRSF